MNIAIGTELWHPLSLDIISHKVIGVLQYEDRVIYIAKATDNVGASGRVEVELSVDLHSVIRFIGLVKDCDYSSGLQDFVEGIYYTDRNEARKAFYKIQKTVAWSNMEEKHRIYKEAKKSYDTCCRILKELSL